ncbi:MAG TPA: DUF1622 domain-containing protein [Conexibacter sp.]|jgi:uncharacterized membrane protein|nr:DUF1622 domain-containing protein [Conexibacter sp.]
MSYEQTISGISEGVELAGVGLLIAGGVFSLVRFGTALALRRTTDAYEGLRRALGRSILVGLEILVGADIIRTIAVSPSFTSVGVLGLVVVVRTFLSFSLEAELEGQWPWQRTQHERLLTKGGR